MGINAHACKCIIGCHLQYNHAESSMLALVQPETAPPASDPLLRFLLSLLFVVPIRNVDAYFFSFLCSRRLFFCIAVIAICI